MSRRQRTWDWIVAYLIPRRVWVWWTRNVWDPLRHGIKR